MRSKTFVVGLLAAIVVSVGVSIYVNEAVDKVDKTIAAYPAPDGRYKAVRVSLKRGGVKPFCFDSISVYLAIYPNSFAESERTYQVYTAPCASPVNPATAPQVEWQSKRTLRITYTPAPPGTDTSKLRRRRVDASNYVHISYVARK